ncbi:MAG: YIP1 family protein [Deltaproteobacteria bacterium]|nr:YIP1 family protein [Deltaproteobacteria bacterium]
MDNVTPPTERPGLPWENRQQLGLVAATIATVRVVLLDATAGFQVMRRQGGLGDPLLFALILGTLGGLAGILWQALMSLVTPVLTGAASEMFETMAGLGIFAVLMPAVVIVSLFVTAGVVHLLLLMVGAARFGFETTFRVIAYSYGSTAVLQVVPIFGGFAAAIWVLVASIFGLMAAQETTGAKASFAVLLPLTLCCLCVCAGVAAAVALGVHSGLK